MRVIFVLLCIIGLSSCASVSEQSRELTDTERMVIEHVRYQYDI